jgi:hypothetical protein
MVHMRVVGRNPLGYASSWPNGPDIHLIGQRALHEVDEVSQPHAPLSVLLSDDAVSRLPAPANVPFCVWGGKNSPTRACEGSMG